MLNATAHGRLGRDVELRFVGQDNQAVADLAIACNYGRKGQDNKLPTQWIKASLWGKQAEALAQHLTKGKGVVVTLSDVHTEEFTGKDGNASSSLVGRVIHFEFAAGESPQGQAAAPARATAPRPQAPAPKASTGFDDMDDDIPFALNLCEYAIADGKTRRLKRADF